MKILVTINGKMDTYSSKAPEWIIAKINTLWKSLNRNATGTVRVVYKKGYWNEFAFKGKLDFWYKLRPCMEGELIDEFSKN